ncbi:MAG: hypothetical protein ACR2PL_09365 [Dehalococcoidia bacterium]
MVSTGVDVLEKDRQHIYARVEPGTVGEDAVEILVEGNQFRLGHDKNLVAAAGFEPATKGL